ncbi:MAG TPA: bifunctional pyr operon transcriptional regulator/uracil phosphoribosyltransferase PyrR [Opitutaceae bacterium]|nr:bifunctional pyr operon transcriptional regulator/uracil phosphoribosyltransferase PyrR [Opitutaceae bacterium]
MASTKTFGAEALYSAIERLSSGIAARHPSAQKTVLLGIANGGIELARRLSQTLKLPVGTLDISFHRDDFGAKPIPKEFTPTIIPFDVTGATVILVDDVLFSGRTVKAALDELFDHGRPAKVELAILVDRGGRMLPLAPDYCGLTLQATAAEKVNVHLDLTDPAKDVIEVIPVSSKA